MGEDRYSGSAHGARVSSIMWKPRTLLFLAINCVLLLSEVQPILCAGIQKLPIGNIPFVIPMGKTVLLEANNSPYTVTTNIDVWYKCKLILEPGVEIKFGPGVGINVRGVLTAKGTKEKPIILTSIEPPDHAVLQSDLRLVDGPSILAGRLQLYHHGQWRSVCTVSRNWTQVDLETACKQLGFQGGELWDWLAPKNETSRLLYEQPGCEGTEATLFECNNWSLRKMGSGVCDNHPDLGIQCSNQYATNFSGIEKYWRGIYFDNAQFEVSQKAENATYEHISSSELTFVDIRYAGVGKDYRAVPALQINGVPPNMTRINVLNSAYDGISIIVTDASTNLNNCNVTGNRGHGLYISSSLDHIDVFGCSFMKNGGNGIRLMNHQRNIPEVYDKLMSYDVCRNTMLKAEYFPTFITAEQNEHSPKAQRCSQILETYPNEVFTLHFISMWADSGTENGAIIEFYNAAVFYEGLPLQEYFMGSINIVNDTRAQSITSTGNTMVIIFKVEPNTRASVFIKVTSTYGQSYDIALRNTTVAQNKGYGIIMENLQQTVHIYQSHIQNNSEAAGIQILHGIGNVFVNRSEIVSNGGDGINVAYSGGMQIFLKCEISFNKGHGIKIWPKNGAVAHYISYGQITLLKDSKISSNEFGMLIGNFCRNSHIEITNNTFSENKNVISISTCTNDNGGILKLQISHNKFLQNQKLGIHLKPAVNIEGLIEDNKFSGQRQGCILIKNTEEDHLDMLSANLTIRENIFEFNHGVFVVNFGLSPKSKAQTLLFLRNTVTNNSVQEPFNLVPRNRASAVVIVSSENVILNRNLIHNNNSKYEIATHLANPNVALNCSLNWLGFTTADKISPRIFDRGHRYNLAKITFSPFLLNSINPGNSVKMKKQTYLPQFKIDNNNVIGGEVSGTVKLERGVYNVEKDIHVLPNSKLILQSRTLLRFPPSIGIIVSGKLEAIGEGGRLNSIRLISNENEVNSTFYGLSPKVPVYNGGNIRLMGGDTDTEGQLQVQLGERWGTVCSYGWSMTDAAVACHSLGLVLDPDNWYMKQIEIPNPNVTLPILLSNVQCTEEDTNIMLCKAERELDFENSCTHEDDVGLRCQVPAWAGMRFSLMAETSKLNNVIVNNAGLLDYSTHSFKPAIQIDFGQHIFKEVRITFSSHDGLAVIHSNLLCPQDMNVLEGSSILYSNHNGITMHQLGFEILDTDLEHNKLSGIYYNPIIKYEQQKELINWLKIYKDKDLMTKTKIVLPSLFVIPQYQYDTISVIPQRTRLILIERVSQPVTRRIQIKCDEPRYLIAIQILNSLQYGSTEEVIIYDGKDAYNATSSWNLQEDLLEFPIKSKSSSVLLCYSSGSNALGDIVLAITAVPDFKTRFDGFDNQKSVSTINSARIQNNKYGIKISLSGRCAEGEEMFLGTSKEVIYLRFSGLKYNKQEAVYIDSPVSDVCYPNIIETTIKVYFSTFSHNKKGIHQYNSNYENTNNIFHWILERNDMESNAEGGFVVSLPILPDLSLTHAHSVDVIKNEWKSNSDFKFDISGGTAFVCINENLFTFNYCKTGLISIHGMEKSMSISYNKIQHNMGHYMVRFAVDSQSEMIEEGDAEFIKNEVKLNRYFEENHINTLQRSRKLSSAIQFHGIQNVVINRNIFENNGMDYELIAGLETANLYTNINAKENWWGSINEGYIASRIMDFNEWNAYANVQFRPFLAFNIIYSPLANYELHKSEKVSTFSGGTLYENITLEPKNEPYIIRNDITVMPNVSLIIKANTTLQFAPNVGILVLGRLYARGSKGREINLLPFGSTSEGCPASNIKNPGVRLGSAEDSEGFLEYYNTKTKQWVPVCDQNFAEWNAEVVCRELGYSLYNVSTYQIFNEEFYPKNQMNLWPEFRNCTGDEDRFQDCPLQRSNQREACKEGSEFVFISCSNISNSTACKYWGGIRFARPEFEDQSLENIAQHRYNSSLEYVNIEGAGILHNYESPCIQIISHPTNIQHTNVYSCASDGINIISTMYDTQLLSNRIESAVGVGISITSLQGSRKDEFIPSSRMDIPYHPFGVLSMCDPSKIVYVKERVILYFQYRNFPITCMKIFRNANKSGLQFRFLQFNLFTSTDNFNTQGSIVFYDGYILSNTSTIITTLDKDNSSQPLLISTNGETLSVKLFIPEGNSDTGFVAEVFTSGMEQPEINNAVEYSISSCVIKDNTREAIQYSSINEFKTTVSMQWNRLTGNCKLLYKNVSTCKAAVRLDIHDTDIVAFKNNLVKENEGGLFVNVTSTNVTSLKAWIENNLFCNNNGTALHVEANQSGPNQQFRIHRNLFIKNYSPYNTCITLKQVISDFSYNYILDNYGNYILEISGYEQEMLLRSQEITKNYFYQNEAINEFRATILADVPELKISDNAFLNPANNYEIVFMNSSLLNTSEMASDARSNWWGFTSTQEVKSRIFDAHSNADMLPVNFDSFNGSYREQNEKCPLASTNVGNSCYTLISVPMLFNETHSICEAVNASHLAAKDEVSKILHLLQNDQLNFYANSQLWIQERSNKCSVFSHPVVEVDSSCEKTHPFICALDPVDEVHNMQNYSTWKKAGYGALITVFLLVSIVLTWWLVCKHKCHPMLRQTMLRFTHEMSILPNPDEAAPSQQSSEAETVL